MKMCLYQIFTFSELIKYKTLKAKIGYRKKLDSQLTKMVGKLKKNKNINC